MNSERRIQDGRPMDPASIRRFAAVRLLRTLLVLAVSIFLPLLLVPLFVRAGKTCDVVVAACQFLLAVLLFCAVNRGESLGFYTLLSVFMMSAYWIAYRQVLDQSVLYVILAASFWVPHAMTLPEWYSKSASLSDAGVIDQRARKEYRAFVLVACLVCGAYVNALYPVVEGKPPVTEYAFLLIAVVAAVVMYVHLRLTLLRLEMTRVPRGLTEKAQMAATSVNNDSVPTREAT